jgi:hypothetical protein
MNFIGVGAKRRAIMRMLKTSCDGNHNSIEASSTFTVCFLFFVSSSNFAV